MAREQDTEEQDVMPATIEKPTSLAAALAAFQANLPRVVKTETANIPTRTGGNIKYSYADLAQVAEVVLPRLGALGLSFTARPTLNADGRFVLAYELHHEASSETIGGEYPLPSSGTAQEIGSAITYARRYTLCSVTGVAPDEDDDGAAASTIRTDVEAPAPTWDPADQAERFSKWQEKIAAVVDPPRLTEVGGLIYADRVANLLSPNTYARLKQAAAAHLATLQPQPNGKAVSAA